MNRPPSPFPPPPVPVRPSVRWTLAALVLSFFSVLVFYFWGSPLGLAVGAPVTFLCGFILFRGWVYPRLYQRKRLALIGLLISGAFTYASLSDVAHQWIYRNTFQLSRQLLTYKDAAGWQVSFPRLWGHEQQHVSGVTNHLFKPSKPTPTLFFSVATRPNAGTEDLELVVESFFMNLPKGGNTQVTEREYVMLPNGQKGYHAVYVDLARRIPIKSEILFVLDKSTLYVLTVGGAPKWFDHHRKYLERLLYSLALPSYGP